MDKKDTTVKLCIEHDFVLTATGNINPAVCARLALRAAGCTIDEPSWERLIAVTPDAPAATLALGFLVATLRDLQRLCAIGQFVVYSLGDGKVAACTAVEWKAKRYELTGEAYCTNCGSATNPVTRKLVGTSIVLSFRCEACGNCWVIDRLASKDEGYNG